MPGPTGFEEAINVMAPAAQSAPFPMAQLIGGGLGLAGTLASGLFGQHSANRQMQFQARMAQQQMEFQERMSSTAHQREVKDLIAAGLNPILSATHGGASTPGGASGSGASASMAPLDHLGRSIQDAGRMQALEIPAMKAQTRLNSAATQAKLSEASVNDEQAGATRAARELSEENARRTRELLPYEKLRLRTEAELNRKNADLSHWSARGKEADLPGKFLSGRLEHAVNLGLDTVLSGPSAGEAYGAGAENVYGGPAAARGVTGHW